VNFIKLLMQVKFEPLVNSDQNFSNRKNNIVVSLFCKR